MKVKIDGRSRKIRFLQYKNKIIFFACYVMLYYIILYYIILCYACYDALNMNFDCFLLIIRL